VCGFEQRWLRVNVRVGVSMGYIPVINVPKRPINQGVTRRMCRRTKRRGRRNMTVLDSSERFESYLGDYACF